MAGFAGLLTPPFSVSLPSPSLNVRPLQLPELISPGFRPPEEHLKVEIPNRERDSSGSHVSQGSIPVPPSPSREVGEWSNQHGCRGPILWRGWKVLRLGIVAEPSLSTVSSVRSKEESRKDIEAQFLFSAMCFNRCLKNKEVQRSGSHPTPPPP